MNPLYSLLNNNASYMNPQIGNFQNMIQQFYKFKSTYSGDPRQQVQNLLNTGQLSQERFNQIAQMATQLQNMMKMR